MTEQETKSWFLEISKKGEDARKNLPEVLSKQKKKLLIAINKNSDDSDFSEENEEFVKKVMHDYNIIGFIIAQCFNCSLFWDDSIAAEHVNSMTKEHAHFDLPKYLECVKIVFLTYSGTTDTQISKAAEYVLTHARQFGDPSKTIFQIDAKREPETQINFIPNQSSVLPDSKFMNKIAHLIEDLRSAYDDTKYQTLNVNATYITLLMLRRLIKKEAEFSAAFKRIHTHDSYVRLCPWPLDNQLPKCDTSKLEQYRLANCAYLAVQAYLNIEDENTKRVLRVTCVQYMEWNGLQLPNLFFKVVELYCIEAGQLWDLLSSADTAISLVQFANVYYKQYKALKNDPSKTQRWFPYCRMLNGDYHKDLSARQNELICLILAYLVDLKIGFDKSSVRLSHWAQSNARMKSCELFATEIYTKINKN